MVARANVPGIDREILTSIKRQHGFDFSEYKPSTLERRVGQRMQTLGFGADRPAYVDFLQTSLSECTTLTELFWINYTGFLRDGEVWNSLADRFLPALLATKQPGAAIRVWSAGCAGGQEAYSLAMMFSQLMGRQAVQNQVTIYATDVDQAALEEARQGCFSLEQVVTEVPPALIQTYFEPSPRRAKVRNSLTFRQEQVGPVIFSQHNLLSDPPLEQIDVVLCRNVLIYFNDQSWERVLTGFGRALDQNGLLVLGRAETPLFFTHDFHTLDHPNRIFGKT